MFLLTIVTARKSSPSMCDVQLPVFCSVRPVALNIGPTRVFASSSLTACLESKVTFWCLGPTVRKKGRKGSSGVARGGHHTGAMPPKLLVNFFLQLMYVVTLF